jgi:hypothetical protein
VSSAATKCNKGNYENEIHELRGTIARDRVWEPGLGDGLLIEIKFIQRQ